jgi:hypothetical protein
MKFVRWLDRKIVRLNRQWYACARTAVTIAVFTNDALDGQQTGVLTLFIKEAFKLHLNGVSCVLSAAAYSDLTQPL